MSSSPLSRSDEASWHEKIRRRELYRCLFNLAHLAENIQITEDFASKTPPKLAILISVTAELLLQSILIKAPEQDLEQINTMLGIITPHLRYVERARVAQTPWSLIKSAEELLKLASNSKNHFIIRPTWAYNYSIIGEFVSFYRELLSCWAWFPLDEWKARLTELGLNVDEAIYCISFPRIERENCLLHANWGHEVGHILVAKWVNDDFGIVWATDEPGIKSRIEDHVKQNIPPVDPLFKDLVIQEAVANQMRATMEVASQGLVELLCDRIGAHILGPSALAATLEFAARFAIDVSPLQSSNYPPWRYRLRMLLQHCTPDLNDDKEMGYPNTELRAFIEWLRTGQRLTETKTDIRNIESNVITKEAYIFITAHMDEAIKKVTSMLPVELSLPYRLHEHRINIAKLVDRLRQGIPPNEICHLSDSPASFQDILSAAWAFKMDKIAKNSSWGSPDEYNLLFRLVLKGCECSYIHSDWKKRDKGE